MTDPRTVETIYETLARGIDRAGPEREALFLAKLALALAVLCADPDQVAATVETCLSDL